MTHPQPPVRPIRAELLRGPKGSRSFFILGQTQPAIAREGIVIIGLVLTDFRFFIPGERQFRMTQALPDIGDLRKRACARVASFQGTKAMLERFMELPEAGLHDTECSLGERIIR